MTDEEIAAKRGEKRGGGSGFGLLGFMMVILCIFAMGALTYATITGDWDTIKNNRVVSLILNCFNGILEMAGIKGHRLGSSATGGAGSDEESRRLARLARFDNQKNMLDNLQTGDNLRQRVTRDD